MSTKDPFAAATLIAALLIAIHAEAADTVPAPVRWKQPRTSWGDPDLQGTWPISSLMSVPLQRPTQYGTRLYFTEEELAKQRKAVESQNQGYKNEESKNALGLGHWVEETNVPVQTSLIVDPPDGQLPAQTPVGKEMSSKMGSDWNREVFPLILDVRDVLRSNGVPIRSGPALCGAASFCGAAAGGCRLRCGHGLGELRGARGQPDRGTR